jgi:hypothetical protein
MKHEILEEVWRVRDQIAAECGYDVKKLGSMLRREESKYADRLARLPIRRRSAPGTQQAVAGHRVHPATHGAPAKPVIALHEEPPRYGGKTGGTKR